MQIYSGIGSSKGVSIGRAMIIYSSFTVYPRCELSKKSDIDSEIYRLQVAKQKSEAQINETEK